MLSLVLCATCVALGAAQHSYTFDARLSDLAAGSGRVYAVSQRRLYQLDRLLRLEALSETRSRLLVVFAQNQTLISCAASEDCGRCQVLDVKNISRVIHSEEMDVGTASNLGLLMDDRSLDTYVLYGSEHGRGSCEKKLLTLRSTKSGQSGEFLSSMDGHSDEHIDVLGEQQVEFVSGFRSGSNAYVLMNVRSSSSTRVRLLSMSAENTKSSTLNSYRDVGLGQHDLRLLSSASGLWGGLWAGVFTGPSLTEPNNTALVLFNISRTNTGSAVNQYDFCVADSCNQKKEDKVNYILNPEAVVFTYPSMTSVAAVFLPSWMVLFIGTGDGQLIKISVDKGLRTTCPRVLHSSDIDRTVLSKMVLDPVDHKHIYMAMGSELKRVSVAQCQKHSTLRDCMSAQDPLCVWCVPEKRCVFHKECKGQIVSISESAAQKKLVTFQAEKGLHDDIVVNAKIHLTSSERLNSSCKFSLGPALPPVTSNFPACSCSFPSSRISAKGVTIEVTITVAGEVIVDQWLVRNCSGISGEPFERCAECVTAGCFWSDGTCTWTSTAKKQPQNVCEGLHSSFNDSETKLISIKPDNISFHGSRNVMIVGENLQQVEKVRIQGVLECEQKEVPLQSRSPGNLTLHMPAGVKGVVLVCALLPSGRCVGSLRVTYGSQPSCEDIKPNYTWASGGRNVSISGQNLQYVDKTQHTGVKDCVYNIASQHLECLTEQSKTDKQAEMGVQLRIESQTVECMKVTYLPDPEFISFKATPTGSHLRITIAKKVDKLNISVNELKIYGMEGEKDHRCVNMEIKSDGTETDSILCDIQNAANIKVHRVKIHVGHFSTELQEQQSHLYYLSILIIVAVGAVLITVCVYRTKQSKLSRQMKKRLEEMECDIRSEIRQGFVDLQTETSALINIAGAIPFLDYKHFASRIFFPEGGPIISTVLQDILQREQQMDGSYSAFSELIQNKVFLISLVHTLEEQENFTIKDKCFVASLLTVVLHNNLPYLTEIMEDLLKALMDRSSNDQTKLLLRRTESIVEKLLTNWMSICLYGFLRESVGKQLFFMVSALNQQISKGPVDSVTEKALYTLNEDWLLWQAQNFSTLKLNVLLPVVGEEDKPVDVNVLDCDTVEQLKDKILFTFKSKFGFPYCKNSKEIDIEYVTETSCTLLREVDPSSQVCAEVTLLNTLKHYKIEDGASIKVKIRELPSPLKTQTSLKDDENFCTKYFHLIDPDIDDQGKKPEMKKLKLKEVYLTKLLSTKVAVHSFVENLFRTIWSTPNNKVSPAIKYFFDFLDSQAENKKITDPDVTHIWKTNSLPLRFWVNILKNPQFVFDIEKSPHLDGCLSVIAQAFMDSFSLADQQLGKHAPTNKLLYAKDIPLYKQEVKAYYKQVKDMSKYKDSEFKAFLEETSKKHENEFNISAALKEMYKYLTRYFEPVQKKLEQNGCPNELKEQLLQVKAAFDSQTSWAWH